jgi:glutamate/tyrosine decarboxylase-like PLP-dependent enzyme
MENFDYNAHTRKELSVWLLPKLEEYYTNTKSRKTAADWDVKEVKDYARHFNLTKSNEAQVIIEHLLQGLNDYSVHTPHPGYFGLFNPRSNFSSILADLITATYNPQLAAWSHSPFANEIENYIIQEFGKKIGYESHSIDGTFSSGGAEANLTAIISALNHAFPDFSEKGLQGIHKKPRIYCSSESHHSIEKAAKVTGLGTQSVESVPVNQALEMDTNALRQQIRTDRKNGLYPLIIIGTAGTTGAGAIDDLTALGEIAEEENLWYHVDAAYGGAAVISSKHKSCLKGIETSDSITLDLHKWFSVPMGASLFLTRKKCILHQSFSIQTTYMPEDGDPEQVVDPYLHSIQWSRRFIGLKIYVPLAIHGWKGYEQVINNQIKIGQLFKQELQEKGWDIINNSALPIICFSKKEFESNEMQHIVNELNASGKFWLSTYPIHGKSTARLCITNYSTGVREVNEFIDLLEYTTQARLIQ